MSDQYRTIYVKVSGVTFEGRQRWLEQITGVEPVRIVPEPDNKYDPNALAVHVAMADGQVRHVGYVPRDLAAEIAPALDGEAIMVKISEKIGGFDLFGGEQANYGLILRVDLPLAGDGLDWLPF